MQRIVIDTNVVISGLFFGGKPRELLKLISENKFETAVSAEIIKEYRQITQELELRYPSRVPTMLLDDILADMIEIFPSTDVHVCRDSDDDKFISCAVDGKCMYIVSGDKDLLSLRRYGEIEILTASEFLCRYNDSEE